MTHRGPFQPLPFCDSVILWLEREQVVHAVDECSMSPQSRASSQLLLLYRSERSPSRVVRAPLLHPLVSVSGGWVGQVTPSFPWGALLAGRHPSPLPLFLQAHHSVCTSQSFKTDPISVSCTSLCYRSVNLNYVFHMVMFQIVLRGFLFILFFFYL